MSPEFSVLEYLGKIGDGVLVLVSAVHDSEYYEATYFYKSDGDVLTLSEELESALTQTADAPSMDDMLDAVRKKVVPYGQIVGRLDHVDFGRWLATEEEEGVDGPLESDNVPGEG
jgi:hypothetical protein